jgi:ATP-dependent exoDNAse (exonuclease V) alpha subunit
VLEQNSEKTLLSKNFTLNPDQLVAKSALDSMDNVFLTGHAGTGKSFVIQQYQKSLPYPLPVLASTGAAAVLIEGRTFHGYFGLGIMEGGFDRTIKKAIGNNRVRARLRNDFAVIIDEISMISPEAFKAADLIAQTVRESDAPFGGLRLIVVGDFLQLPPITPYNQQVQWLFDMELWEQLNFKTVNLKQTMRTQQQDFINVLNSIREGQITDEVKDFLDSKIHPVGDGFNGTVLFGRRQFAENFNIKKLNQIQNPEILYPTEVKVASKVLKTKEALLNLSPLPSELKLKKDALVMLRKNDPDLRYVNGSLGRIEKLLKDEIQVVLFTGQKVFLTKEEFHILDADGKKMATITNFPISLAWASTIHKSQGASIDKVHVDLRNLWECGQAYVALSRARTHENLFIEGWSTKSIRADQTAVNFYKSI